MDYKAFEKRIAEQLGNNEEPLDTEAFIAQLHKDKKRRNRWWLWFLIFLSSGSAGYGIYMLYTGNHTTDNNFSKISNQDSNTSIVAKDNHASLPIKTEAETNLSYALSAGNTSQDYTSSQRILLPENPVKTAFIRNNTFMTQNNNVQKPNPIQDKAQNHTNEVSKENDGQRTPENTFETSTSYATGILPLLPTVIHNFNSDYQFNLSGDNILCPDFSSGSKFIFEIIPEAGVFLPIKSIKSLQAEPLGFLGKRQHEEQSLEGLNLGLYGKLSHSKSPLFLKAGISWSKLTERMRLDYAYTQRDTSKGIISITYSQTGDTITTIIGDIITEKKLSGSKTRHYSFKMWDFPVVFGYEKNWNRWFAGGEIGAVFNASVLSEGHILNSDTSFINLIQPVAQFKTRLDISYTCGIYLGYNLNNHGRIYLNGRMRWIPDDWNNTTSLFSQQYTFAGIYAGYGYTF